MPTCRSRSAKYLRYDLAMDNAVNSASFSVLGIGVATWLSAISLIVSVVTFYLTQVRRPKIVFFAGETASFCHIDHGFELHVPTTFNNTAHRTGIVTRCSVVVSFPGDSPTSYYIQWSEFRKFDDDQRRWIREEFAGPLTVEGRSSAQKMLMFEWRAGEVLFPKGNYKITFYVWIAGSGRPKIVSSHTGYLSAPQEEELAKFRSEDKSIHRWFPLDQQIERNKLLTEHEIKTLLHK
jgi:hypothetical protein